MGTYCGLSIHHWELSSSFRTHHSDSVQHRYDIHVIGLPIDALILKVKGEVGLLANLAVAQCRAVSYKD